MRRLSLVVAFWGMAACAEETIRFDGGRLLVERYPSKALKVADNVAALEKGSVPDYAVGNVIRWLEFNKVDCTRFRERYHPTEPELGEPLGARKGFRLGFMLDISRNRIPTMATLKDLVDALAAFGYNEFQLYNEVSFAYSAHPDMSSGWSPLTADEIRELDDYCWARGIVLTPNQNSFGHLEKLFRHTRYLKIAEAPKGYTIRHPPLSNAAPSALCATDPKALDFLAGLYDEFLPLFRHDDRVHVGCDEVWDIFGPMSRSAAKAAKLGVPRVYTDFLLGIGDLCRERRRRMMFWADMMLLNFDLLSELPKDAIPINWGYGGEDALYPGYTCEFEGRCLALKRQGLEFYVAPSDNLYGMFFGKYRRMRANVDMVVAAGRKYGASGLLLTSWGDGGHRAPWIMSLPAIAYTAARVRGEELTDAQVAAAVDRVLGCKLGEMLVGLGSVCEPEGAKVTEVNPTPAYAAALRAALAKGDRSALPSKVAGSCDMLALGVDMVAARAGGTYAARTAEFGRRFAAAWLKDSRPGGLHETLQGPMRLPVPKDFDAMVSDASVGPVLRLTPSAVDAIVAIASKKNGSFFSDAFGTNASTVVIEGRLGLDETNRKRVADALVDYVRAGGGLALVKPDFADFRGEDAFLQMIAGSARDTLWTTNGTWRFVNERPRDPVNAALRDVPASFSRRAAIPAITSFFDRSRCEVLVSVDLADGETRRAERAFCAARGSGEVRADGDYPVSWIRTEGKGRIFCTLFGADDPVLKRHVTDGIRYAAGALPKPPARVRTPWQGECRLDWANGVWHERLAGKAASLQGRALDLVVFGDSISQFWESSQASSQQGGKEVWERQFGAFGERSAVFGMAGDRTENLLWRVTEGGEADGWTAKTIAVLVGINNRMCPRAPQAKGDTPEETARGVREVVRALRRHHPESKIVVFGLLPTAGAAEADWVRACNRALAGFDWGAGVIFRDIGARFRKAGGAWNKDLFRDSVHLNGAGYALWAEELNKETAR